jgi:hypothetical protein
VKQAAYCRINLKLMEAIAADCREFKTELNKYSVEQAQDIVQ